MGHNGNTVLVGFDLGYGNAKCVATQGGEFLAPITLPVGAAEADKAGKDLNGQTDFSQGVEVYIGGKSWIAGVEPTQLQGGFARQTHDKFVSTPEYKAMALALMSKLNVPEIDYLVTGLPCSDFLGNDAKALKSTIVKQLRGEHWVNAKQRCRVNNVLVVTQPLGAYVRMMNSDETFIHDADALTLICDIGYGTADWCVLQGGKLWDENSGSSLEATSRILEQAAVKIVKDFNGNKLSAARLEHLYRNGETVLHLGGEKIPYQMYLHDAAREISRRVMANVASSMRTLKDSVSQILLTGGGAPLYEIAAREAFSSLSPMAIKVDSEPVLANAYGFQMMAVEAFNQSQGNIAA